jgi:uronate dehydrogenase
MIKSIRCDLPLAIFFGISNNTQRKWDISNAQKLIGYEPQDNAADYLPRD